MGFTLTVKLTITCQLPTALQRTFLQIYLKTLQGELFVKFREVITGWKNIDNLDI